MRRLGCVMAACLIGTALGECWSARGDESQVKSNASVEQIATELIDLFDVVLDHHVTPITKQQMVQYCLAHGYLESGRVMPGDLVVEISETVDNERFLAILRRELPAILRGSSDKEIRLASALASAGVRVMPTKAQRVDQQLAANRYVGIGIVIGAHGGEFPVMHKILAGGPADQAGAKNGDVITEVDGQSLSGTELNQVIDRLRGSDGSRVDLTLRRAGVDRSVTMTRGVVPMPTVSEPVFSKSGETVGIKLERVSASNVHELRRLGSQLQESVKTVVIDFRTSDGAERLHYGELLGSALVDGKTIGYVADRTGSRRRFDAEPGNIFSGRDLIVIVDGKTSGVLKWIAAALQDSGQAMLMGDPSTAAAMASATIEMANEMSVTMPVKIMYRAGGEQLFVNSDLLAQRDSGKILQQIRVSGMEGRQQRVDGVLYPDKTFPFTFSTQQPPVSYQGRHELYRIRDLNRLLDYIETGSLESLSMEER